MLAKNLGMEVVAEGIERPDQVAMLRQMGCQLGQGYLFSKPVDAASSELLLRSQYPVAGVGDVALAAAASCSLG
jgi:EAL domain-containing protein (putative c-di-GMP-specific phosphodiesterase class I)